MAWGSTHKTNLHKVHLKRKYAIRVTCNGHKFTHTKSFMRSLQVLNVFQINIQKIFVFMHFVKTCSDAPNIFANKFTYLCQRYPTNISNI